MKENEGAVGQIYNEQKRQENVDFDSMVANILTEHKDEIKKNVEQQQLITSRLQRQQVKTLNLSFNEDWAGMTQCYRFHLTGD